MSPSLLLQFLCIARTTSAQSRRRLLAALTALALLASLTAASPAAAEAPRDLTDIVLFQVNNNAATGAPTIDGAARVGQTLTADTSGIHDIDGLTSVDYSYQWIRVESSNEADIAGATDSTYFLIPEDKDRTIKVRVTFTDDLSNPESLVSDATDPVVVPSTTQVKNTGQTILSNWPLSATITGLGQAFTTGSDPVGYVLSSIGISLQTSDSSAAATSTTVTLNPTDDDGKPGDALCTLDDPDTFTTSSGQTFVLHTFTAPTTGDNLCPTLAADTTYAVLVLRAADATTNVRLPKTSSTAEDTLDPGTGWTIANSRLNRRIDDGETVATWSTNTGSHLIEVETVHPLIAQGLTTLVSNLGQLDHTNPAGVGSGGNGDGFRAQGFKTGPDLYTLDSIEIPIRLSITDQYVNGRTYQPAELISATLNAGGSNPAGALCTLINPTTFSRGSDAVRISNPSVFTALSTGPGACPTLSASTKYFLVIRWANDTNIPAIPKAASTAEDTPATGWRIDNNGTSWNGSSSSWYMSNDDVYGDRGLPIFLRVTGAVVQVNTPGVPAISGVTQVGRTLTASTAPITDSDGLDGVTFNYQWVRVDGASETDIDGATSRRYTLTGDDQGKRLRVKVSYIDNANNNDSVTSDPSGTVIPRANSAATGAPTISGLAQVGETLTASTDDITDGNGLDDVAFNYQWLRADGTEIAEATNSTYILGPDDKGKQVKVRVSFIDEDGYSESVVSVATETIVAPNSDAIGQPTISGTKQVGETLTADVSGIVDSNGLTGVEFNYQWIRVNGADEDNIANATNSTYLLGPADKDKNIKVKVSFIDNDGYDESVVSVATETITVPPNSDATGAPTISGTKQVDKTLTADVSGIVDSNGLTGVTFNYQWIRVDGTEEAEIDDADSSTYTLVNADRGKTIKVKVSFIDNAGHDESVTSIATDTIAASANHSATGRPTINGTRLVGFTLTADITEIDDRNGLVGVEFNYQWILVTTNDNTGLPEETDIPEANSSTYPLGPLTTHNKIKVKVTFTDEAGYDESVTSIVTGKIRGAIMAATGQPTVSGTAQVGETLTASTENIDDSNGLTIARTNDNFDYQWIRVDGEDEADIDGAESSTYLLVDEDEGKKVKVEVSFYDDDLWIESVISIATETVVAAAATNTAPIGLPTIEGTPRVHESLKADIDGIFDGDGLGTGSDDSYQWIRVDNGIDADIPGATSDHYTLTDNDLGKRIKVRFSFTDGGGATEELVSAAYDVIAGPIEVTVATSPATDPPALTVAEGGTGTYTVKLTDRPSKTVTVTVTAGGDVTTQPASLTFTTGTWSTAQIVTVSASHDTDLADDTVTLTHAATRADIPNYAITIDGVAVTVTDDDTAAVTVSTSALTVGEGGSGSYTVELNFQPSADVTVTVGAGGDVTAEPASLTFSTTTWDTAQTVTVRADQDDDTTNDAVTLTHTVATGSAAEYIGTAIAGVEVTVTDNDTAGATVSKSALTVGEGGSGIYTVELNFQPSDTVTINVGAGGDVTAEPASLTFTTGTWSTAQTVTVRAGHDDDLVDDTVTLTHSASSTDSDYDGVTVAGVDVTVTDDDTAGVTVTPSTLTVGEGGSGSYTVELNQAPSDTVTVAVAAGGDVTVEPETLTFTTGDWDSARTVTVRADHDDDLVDDTVTLTHAASSDDSDFDGVSVGSVEVTVTDDDTAAVTVSTSALTVGEGGSGSYTVELDFQPSHTVTITVGAGGDVTAEPETLTFSTTTWDSAQTVTVRAGHDDDLVDDTVTLTHSASSTDSDYDNITVAGVDVTVTDDDTAGVTVTPSTLTVGEGGSGSYTVELNQAPSDTVTVAVAAGGDVTVEPETLTFTTGDWDSARTVTVRADHDDDLVDDTVTLTHAASSDDSDFDGVTINSVEVTVTDDDTAAVTVSTSALTVGEGGSGSYTVELDFQPSHTVTIDVTAGGDVTAEPETLTFSTTTWDSAQTVTVRAGHDDDLVDDTVTLTHSASSTDSDYDNITVAGVDVTVTDDDTAGVTVTPSTLTVGEGGSGSYTVELNQAPSDTVTVTVAAGGDVTVEPETLTFTTGDWDSARTVTVRADHDDDLADDTVTLTHAATSDDSDFDGVTINSVEVTVTDDDTAAVTVSTSALTVGEGGSGSYTVELDFQPSHTVTIDVTAGGDVTAEPETLTFSTTTWDSAQTVTVRAGHDDDLVDDTVTLTHSASSTDSDYDNISVAGVEVTVTDDDTAGVTVTPSTLTVGEGGSGSYTVELNQAPSDTVTVAVAAGGDVTVEPETLTFTTGDWDSARTVTVRADHDDDLVDDTVTLTHAASSDDSDFDGVTINSVEVTVTDDDTAAVTVSTSALTVGEGGSGSYTVELDFQPSHTVTITVGAGGDVSVDPASLTFSTTTWDSAQTVTVRAGHDDDLVDDTVTLTHSASSTDSDYDNITVAGVDVTVTDDDTAGVTVTPSTLTVGEGGSGSYTVELNQAPSDTVTVAVAAGGDVTVEPETLTFTTGDWDSARTVTVRADHDDDLVDDTVTLTHAATSDDSDFDGVTINSVEVTVTDDDTAAVTVSTSALTVGEGGSGSYTVELDFQPSHTVTIDVTAGGDVTAEPETLTFSTTTWDSAQTVTVRAGHDDDLVDDTVTLTHSASSTDSDYDNITVAGVDVTVTDDDTAGVTVTPSTLTVGEGGSGSYTVELNQAPSDTVTVAVAAGGDVTVEPETLTFTTGDWDSARTVTVRADHDDDLVDDTVTLTHAASSDDSDFDGVTINSVEVTVTDDDTAAVTVSTSALTVGEGGSGSYTVELDFQPSHTVTIDVTAGGDVTAEPETLTFSTTTWDSAQTVTVRAGHDDDLVDDTVTLTHSASSTDSDYDNISVAGVDVTVTDDDTAGVTVTPSTLTVGEGGSGSYTVELNQAPSDTVTVAVAAGGDVTVEPETLTFTTGDWDSARTVTVRADHDDDLVDDTVTLTHAASSDDSDFDGVTINSVEVTVTDDDTAAVTVSTSALTVGEGGSGSYTVELDFQPSHTVTITVGAGGDVSVDPASLTFSTTTWDSAQTVTVRAGHDDDLVDDTVTLTHSASSTDSDYDNITVAGVDVTVTDDDTAAAMVSESALTVGEGSTGTYTVKLRYQPAADVTVTVSAGDDVTTEPTSLTFTTDTWDSAQTVTVRAGHDDDTANDTVPLTHTAASPDSDYDNVAIAGVDVTVTDDDEPAATVSTSVLTVGEGSTGTYTVVLDFQPADIVTIDVTARGDVTADPASLTFTTDTWDTAQTVTVTAGHDTDLADDTVMLTHTATSFDIEFNAISIDSVDVTVTDDDTAAVTVSDALLTVGEGGSGTYNVKLDYQPSATVTIAVTARGDVTVEPETLTFTTSDWDNAQTVVVKAGHDTDLADDTVTLAHTVATGSAAEYLGTSIGGVEVTVTDDDTAAATVSTSVLTVTEGASDIYTVKLDYQPSATVTIDVTAGDDVTASPASLTFTTDTWHFAQTVTVRADQDDDLVDDTVTLTHAVAADSAAEYRSVSIGSVAVTVTDNDTPSASVTPSTLTVGEGGSGTYTVELNHQPSADVTIDVTAGGDVTADPASLTFTTDTWDTAQSVTVTAGPDDDTINDAVTLTHTVATGSAAEYRSASVNIGSVAVTVTDNDIPAITVSESALTVGEGSTGTYTVELDYQPSASVTINVGVGGDVTAEPASLTFTTDTWDTAQTVTVSAGPDDDTIDDAVTLIHTVATDSAAEYTGVGIGSVRVTVTDNDTAAVTVSDSELTVQEGSTGTYTVKLDYQPSATVTITVGAGGDVTARPASLTFMTNDWNSAQTVIVTAGHDNDLAADTVTLTHTATSHDIDFNGVGVGSVRVTVTDDDTAAATVSTPALTVAEGDTGTYTVKLDYQPSASVTIDVGAGGDVTANPASLTFTTAAWATAQTVTVSAGPDDDMIDDAVTLTHTVATGSAAEYVGTSIGSVDVTVTDDGIGPADASTNGPGPGPGPGGGPDPGGGGGSGGGGGAGGAGGGLAEPPEPPDASEMFGDVEDGAYYEPAVAWMVQEGITVGCASEPLRYCPGRPVTRAEMASFLARALDLETPAQRAGFADVEPSGVHAGAIEALYGARITVGCASEPLRYCPGRPVTRAQMASFLARALDLETPAQRAGFADVEPSGVHAGAIEALYGARITVGCASEPLRYCPDRPVTRAQMAAFLYRARTLIAAAAAPDTS